MQDCSYVESVQSYTNKMYLGAISPHPKRDKRLNLEAWFSHSSIARATIDLAHLWNGNSCNLKWRKGCQ